MNKRLDLYKDKPANVALKVGKPYNSIYDK